MMISYELNPETKLSKEQEELLSNLANRPIAFDEDAPELSEAELEQFYRVAEKRREDRRKQTVTLRLSPQTLRTAKSLGKGYTAVLARILEGALKDKDIIQRYL